MTSEIGTGLGGGVKRGPDQEEVIALDTEAEQSEAKRVHRVQSGSDSPTDSKPGKKGKKKTIPSNPLANEERQKEINDIAASLIESATIKAKENSTSSSSSSKGTASPQ